MLIYNLITTAVSTVFYGIIATAVLMLLLFVVIRLFRPTVVRNILFYPLGVVLVVLLVAQFTMLFGAMEAKSIVSDVESGMIIVKEGAEGALESAVPRQYLDELTGNYPLIGLYIEGVGAGENTPDIGVSAIVGTIHEELSGYVWRRVWWITGAAFVASAMAFMLPCPAVRTYSTSSYDFSETSTGDTDEWGL